MSIEPYGIFISAKFNLVNNIRDENLLKTLNGMFEGIMSLEIAV